MKTRPLDSQTLRETLIPILNDSRSGGDDNSLETALTRFIDVFDRIESEKISISGLSLSANEITELGEYGTSLLKELLNRVEQHGNGNHKTELMALIIDLALWVCRNDGELLTLEPVVDSLAYFANNSGDTHYLEALHGIASEIVRGVAHSIRQDLEKSNPGRPWRILNLNKAIMATRSHNPQLMEQAFQDLVNNLPEDMPQFFREGMEQMDALDYPPHVRKIMERFYQRFGIGHSVH